MGSHFVSLWLARVTLQWSSLRCIWDTTCHLPPSIGIVYITSIITSLSARCGNTAEYQSAEHSLFRTISASLALLGCAHGMIYYSVIWNKLLASRVARETRNFSSFRPRVFSDLSGVHGYPTPTVLSHLDQSLFPSVDDILATFASNGPLLSRLILTGAIASPIVAISLQRDTVDIGGNQGMLSIGELPAGLAMEDLNWVTLRGYTTAEGGLPAPEESPNEVHLSARIFSTLMSVESDLPHYLGSRH